MSELPKFSSLQWYKLTGLRRRYISDLIHGLAFLEQNVRCLQAIVDNNDNDSNVLGLLTELAANCQCIAENLGLVEEQRAFEESDKVKLLEKELAGVKKLLKKLYEIQKVEVNNMQKGEVQVVMRPDAETLQEIFLSLE